MNDGMIAWLVLAGLAVVIYAFRGQTLKYTDREEQRSIDRDRLDMDDKIQKDQK